MNPTIFGLLVCFLGNTLITMADAQSLTKSISQFTTDLYTTVISGQSSNIVLSPISAQIILTLTYMGAEGETATAMLTGLKLSGSKSTISGQMKQLIGSLEDNASLKVANNIFLMENYQLQPTFEATAKEDFYSDIQLVNFAQNTEAAETINTWVENKTDDKITNLISADALGPDTRMVLVNAIYFKGSWKYQFVKKSTAKAAFYTSNTDSVQVDMMHVQENFRYGTFSDLNVNCIELPYKDSNVSMLFILPTSRTGLAEFELNLKNVDIIGLSKKMRTTEVVVSIPKFRIEFGLSLVNALSTIGMSNIFSNSANFSSLLDSKEPLSISEVVQKAFIDVNEEGVEAAAATAVIVTRALASLVKPPPIVFKADHPFTFILKKNDDILFIGRFVQ